MPKNPPALLIAGIMLLAIGYLIGQGTSRGGPRTPETYPGGYYYDLKHYFRVDFPEGRSLWRQADPNAGVVFRIGDTPQIGEGIFNGDIVVTAILNPNNLSIPNLFATFNDTSRFWFQRFSYTPVTINNLQGFLFSEIADAGPQYNYVRSVLLLAMEGRVISVSMFHTAGTDIPSPSEWEMVKQSVSRMP